MESKLQCSRRLVTSTVVSPDGPGNYVVLLYQDPDGKTKALSFFDPKFVIAG